jgi:hypothetical protein
MDPVLAAATGGTGYLGTINSLLTGLAGEITGLLVPAGVIGVVFGAAMWLLGNAHGPQIVRSAGLALAVGGVATTVVPALVGTGGH